MQCFSQTSLLITEFRQKCKSKGMSDRSVNGLDNLIGLFVCGYLENRGFYVRSGPRDTGLTRAMYKPRTLEQRPGTLAHETAYPWAGMSSGVVICTNLLTKFPHL